MIDAFDCHKFHLFQDYQDLKFIPGDADGDLAEDFFDPAHEPS